MEYQDPGSAKCKKVQSEKTCIKIMYAMFFNSEGLMDKEFLHEDTILKDPMYVEIVKCLLQWIKRAHPGPDYRTGTWGPMPWARNF